MAERRSATPPTKGLHAASDLRTAKGLRMAKGTGEPHRAQYVYGRLCEALRYGHFRPGEKLKLREIAELYNTSLTPARDALQRLVAEQALVSTPNSSIEVPNPSVEEVRETRRIRMELEGMAAEAAARAMTPEKLAELQAINRRYDETIASGDWRSMVAVNAQFHLSVYEMANMPILLQIIEGLWLRNGPILGIYYRMRGDQHVDPGAHNDILDALAQGDSRAARRAVRADLELATRRIFEIRQTVNSWTEIDPPKTRARSPAAESTGTESTDAEHQRGKAPATTPAPRKKA